jgi:hypothetical protein
MAQWKLYIGIPNSVPDLIKFCQKLEKEIGADDYRCGSGLGLGFRDIDWEFPSKRVAKSHMEKVVKFLGEHKIKVQTDPTKEDWKDGLHAYAWINKA